MKKFIMILLVVGIAIPLSVCLTVAQPRGPRIIIEAPVPPPPPRIVVRPAPVFPLPPPIIFAEPPEMVVLPETEVYVVPEYEQDIYFYNGFWFRLWEGRWYRSLYYDRGWGFYRGVPSWYGGIYPNWRENYRTGMWGGHPWEHHRIPHHEFRNNWRGWHDSGHWKNHNNWGTKGMHNYGGTRHLDKGTVHSGTTGTRHLDKGTVHSGTSGTRQYNKSSTGTINKPAGTTRGTGHTGASSVGKIEHK